MWDMIAASRSGIRPALTSSKIRRMCSTREGTAWTSSVDAADHGARRVDALAAIELHPGGAPIADHDSTNERVGADLPAVVLDAGAERVGEGLRPTVDP